MKPYSEACEQNKDPILAILRVAFENVRNVLEIGSGTGQHAVYFSEQLPQLRWQTSDLPENHPGIHAWLQEAGLKNTLTPVAVTAVGTMIIERSVQAEPATAFQQFAGTGEQALYCRPVHNMCGVGAEQSIVAFLGCVLWP